MSSTNLISDDSLQDEDSTLAVSAVTTTVRRKCCQFPPSPYPMYIANVFYLTTLAINSVACEDILYNKVCYQHFKNISLCTNSTFSSAHPDLQAETAVWSNYNSLVKIPLSIFVNLMLSSYCDKVGHKLPYVLPCIGGALATIYLAILASPQFISWPMGSIFGYSILYSMLGSFPMVVMSSFSYVGLVVSRDRRAVAMGMCESSLIVGVLIGTVINGPIIDSIGLSSMAYINAFIALIPLPVVLIFLTDVTSESSHRYTWRDMIGLSHLLDAFKCVFRRREGNKRLLLNLCFAVYTCIYVAVQGYAETAFLYLVKEKELSLTQFSIYNGCTSAVKGIAGPGLIYLLKRFANPEQYTVGLAALSFTVIGYAVIPIDSIPYSIWIGGMLTGLQLTAFAVIRSMQISFCEKDELGKMFAYDAIIQSTFGIAGSVAVKALYSATLTIWAGMYLAVCSLLNLVALIGFVCLALLTISNNRRNPSPNDNLL